MKSLEKRSQLWDNLYMLLRDFLLMRELEKEEFAKKIAKLYEILSARPLLNAIVNHIEVNLKSLR